MEKILFNFIFIIIGIINIVLAILNANGVFFSLQRVNDYVRFILPFQGIEVALTTIYQIYPKLAVIIKDFVSPFVGYTISIMLFISGVGLILQKAWGRAFTYLYTKSIIIISLIGLALNIFGYIKEFMDHDKFWFIDDAFVWGGALAYIFILVGTLLYPIILLIFFSRPKIKELFAKK